MPEEAIKAIHVQDGTELSKVGFLSRPIVAVEKEKATYTGRFVQVIKLNEHSAKKIMSLKSKRDMGFPLQAH